MNSPPRGEVWLVDLGLAAKVRPCVAQSVPIWHVTAGLPYDTFAPFRAKDRVSIDWHDYVKRRSSLPSRGTTDHFDLVELTLHRCNSSFSTRARTATPCSMRVGSMVTKLSRMVFSPG